MSDAKPVAAMLPGYADAARRILGARTLADLSASLWSLLESLGAQAQHHHMTVAQARQTLQFGIQHMAASPEPLHAQLGARLWRILAAPSATEQVRSAWLKLTAQGTSWLREQYLQDLASIVPEKIGTEVLCVADLGGEPLYVQTPEEWREALFGSVRVRTTARRLAMTLAADCRAPGVFALGRLRIVRHERQLRMLLEARLSFDLSATGLPAIVVRGVRSDMHDDFPPMPEPVPQAITLPQRLALAV